MRDSVDIDLDTYYEQQNKAHEEFVNKKELIKVDLMENIGDLKDLGLQWYEIQVMTENIIKEYFKDV